ncbi:hypothetical protein B296_00007499 [Ensete ventricosum]|uniref:Uncharacterized protein n=1 Tax=Ensete ventricosum TaxID=4639 RepID=A0A427ABY9_ENSVE|nr:hypothetical protein B296_00007499 [Ensete ventricosum]
MDLPNGLCSVLRVGYLTSPTLLHRTFIALEVLLELEPGFALVEHFCDNFGHAFGIVHALHFLRLVWSVLGRPAIARDSEQDEREVGYSPRAEEAQSSAPIGKRSHKKRLTMVETLLDVLEATLEELYQGKRRLLGVESSQDEAESQIDRVESLIDRLTEDTKDSVRHLQEVVAELMAISDVAH